MLSGEVTSRVVGTSSSMAGVVQAARGEVGAMRMLARPVLVLVLGWAGHRLCVGVCVCLRRLGWRVGEDGLGNVSQCSISHSLCSKDRRVKCPCGCVVLQDGI